MIPTWLLWQMIKVTALVTTWAVIFSAIIWKLVEWEDRKEQENKSRLSELQIPDSDQRES